MNDFGSILSSTNEKQQKAVKNRRIKDMGGEKMICTVTFNPSLDYIVSVEDFKLGLTNRTSSELMLPAKDQRSRADESWDREYSTWFHGRIRRR